jgi:hypothetical protein
MSAYTDSLIYDKKRGVYIPKNIELYLVVEDYSHGTNYTAKSGSYVYLHIYTPEEDLGNHNRYVIYDINYSNHGNMVGFDKVAHCFQKTGWDNYDQMIRENKIDKILEN